MKITNPLIQVFRRLTQVSVILLVFGLIVLSLYGHYRESYAFDNLTIHTNPLMQWILSNIDSIVSKLDDPEILLDNFKGNLWSMRLFGLGISDPLAFLETMFSSKKIYLPLLLSILIPLIVTLIKGRVFCSWICPGYVLFELNGKLSRFFGFKHAAHSPLYKNKYIILIIGLIFAFITSIPLFPMIYPPALLSRLAHAWIFGTPLKSMMIFILIILSIEFFVYNRWWCRTMCPGGALYGLLGKKRLLKVKLDKSLCTECGICKKVCEQGLYPVTESEGIECDNCGVCIKHCQTKALFFELF
ncbi:MAG: 4Fe-4S binding protein [Nitrospirae bacterium]|nr:4Fe-4S binding protein [Nitrospirota bacterium]